MKQIIDEARTTHASYLLKSGNWMKNSLAINTMKPVGLLNYKPWLLFFVTINRKASELKNVSVRKMCQSKDLHNCWHTGAQLSFTTWKKQHVHYFLTGSLNHKLLKIC